MIKELCKSILVFNLSYVLLIRNFLCVRRCFCRSSGYWRSSRNNRCVHSSSQWNAVEVKKEARSQTEVLSHFSYLQHPVSLGEGCPQTPMIHKGVTGSSREPSEWQVPSAPMTWRSRKIWNICVIPNKTNCTGWKMAKFPASSMPDFGFWQIFLLIIVLSERFSCLLFGFSSSSEIFQREKGQSLECLEGMVCHFYNTRVHNSVVKTNNNYLSKYYKYFRKLCIIWQTANLSFKETVFCFLGLRTKWMVITKVNKMLIEPTQVDDTKCLFILIFKAEQYLELLTTTTFA